MFITNLSRSGSQESNTKTCQGKLFDTLEDSPTASKTSRISKHCVTCITIRHQEKWPGLKRRGTKQGNTWKHQSSGNRASCLECWACAAQNGKLWTPITQLRAKKIAAAQAKIAAGFQFTQYGKTHFWWKCRIRRSV